MTFQTVVFGTGVVTGQGAVNYSDGDSIPSGGYRLFIVPKKNMGNNPIDIGFTYVNQFGAIKTSSVTTAIAPNTTAGTHVQAVLESGDTGIRDLIGVSMFVGGSPGDNLSFESYNEGTGRSPIEIAMTDPFDRNVPGSHIFEPYIGLYKGKTIIIPSLTPELYYSNPGILPMQLIKSNITEFISELIINRGITSITIDFSRAEMVSWISEPLSTREYTGKDFFIFKSWLESVVGQVLSGYVTNTQNQIIKNAISLIMMSTARTETAPTGASMIGDVDANTGLYQAFLKKLIYDKRYIIIRVATGKSVILEGGGIPAVVDGTKQLPIPYNLQFECPTINCDFNVTRKQK